MPRATLPQELKSLVSYDVLLTRTTEDDLWTHFTGMFPEWVKYMEDHIENALMYYTKEVEEDEMNLDWKMLKFLPEFEKCGRVFAWDVKYPDYNCRIAEGD